MIVMVNPLRDLTQEELECECDECEHPDACGKCPVFEERELRLTEREIELRDREEDLYIREVNFGQDRDVYHNGSIIKGGGVCQPEWMDDERYGEYKRTAEYAYEVGHVSYSEFDEPEYDESDYCEDDY